MPNTPVPAAAPGLPARRTSLLTPSHAYDRAAIMRAARAEARGTLARQQRMPRIFAGLPMPVLTLRQAFAEALRRQWDMARGLRAIRLWRDERDAEEARRQTLPERERRILVLQEERALAPYIDSTAEMIRQQSAIDAQLAALNAAA